MKKIIKLLLIILAFNSCDDENSTEPIENKYSLKFNGSDSYVEIPFADNHDLFGDFSIEFWTKFENTAKGKIVSKVGWFDQGDSVCSYSVYFDENFPNKIIFSTWVGQFPNVEHKIVSVSQLTPNNWHHIVVTYEEENQIKKIYIDEVLDNSEENTGNIGYNGRPLLIGAFKTNLGDVIFPYNGNIDELRLWDKKLTSSEIEDLAKNILSTKDENLLAYWNFEEGSGNIVNDMSIYKVSGTITNPTWGEGVNN